MEILFIILIVLGVVILGYFYLKHHKKLVYNCVAIFTGAPKTGKTALSVQQAIKIYRRNLFRYYLMFPIIWIKKHNEKTFVEIQKEYRPMLYSNIKLRYVKFNPFTKDILLRKVRIPNKSVILLDEMSLIADSMLFKDTDINENLMWFVKLFGHYSHGGYLIMNTQSITDNHFSIKRCISTYFRIFQTIRLPFFSIMKVRECVHSEDNDTINTFDKDVSDTYKYIFIWNKTFKIYDCYCLSIFTDNLTIQVDYDVPKLNKFSNLKTTELVTFQDVKNLYKGLTKGDTQQ